MRSLTLPFAILALAAAPAPTFAQANPVDGTAIAAACGGEEIGQLLVDRC